VGKSILIDVLIIHNGSDTFAIRKLITRSGAMMLSRVKLCVGDSYPSNLNHVGVHVQPDKASVGRRC